MSEEEFYATTPKKLFKLAQIHHEVNNPSSPNVKAAKPEEKYIDQIAL